MSISWYNTFTFFGYEIIIPENTTYRKFCKELYGINSIVEPPFEITGILSDFHNQLDSSDTEELTQFDEQAYLVIGFKPQNDMEEMLRLSIQLSEYVIDNPLLEGINFSIKPRFFSGIDWFETLDDDSDNDDSDDDSDNDDSDDDSDNEGEGEGEDDDSKEYSMEEEDDESLGIQEYKK
jgi:hypothetical protein